MRNDDLCYLTATATLDLFRRRKLSPVELVTALIAREFEHHAVNGVIAFNYHTLLYSGRV